MNDADLKVRKQWLIGLFGVIFFNVVLYFLNLPYEAAFAPTGARIFLYANGILTPLIFFYILYRCAYKKPGTKYLSFVVYASPVLFALGMLMMGLNIMQGVHPVPGAKFWAFIILSQASFAYWYYLCYKMRKVNQRLQGVIPQ